MLRYNTLKAWTRKHHWTIQKVPNLVEKTAGFLFMPKDRFMQSVLKMIRDKKKRVHKLCQKARLIKDNFRNYVIPR